MLVQFFFFFFKANYCIFMAGGRSVQMVSNEVRYLNGG